MMNPHERDLILRNPEAWLCYRHGMFRPRSRSVELRFDSGTPDGNPIQQTFDKTGSFIGTRMVHTLRRPNYLVGSSAKRAADVAAAQMPYVDVRFHLDSNADGREYILNGGYSPLENESTFMQTSGQDDSWNCCWILMYPDFLSVEAILKISLAAEELPYIVTMTLKGMQVSTDNCWRGMPDEELWGVIKEKYPEIYSDLHKP